MLVGDPIELREALINLVFNAVDALPKGGIITFVTRAISTGTNGESEQQLQLEVRDNGTGMDEKTRLRCMEPFFSTKTMRGGTGLGLAMVYGMIQRHDGKIEVESSPGRGTCIRLTFPLKHKVSPVVPKDEPVIESGRSLRVLCIDDDEFIRTLLDNCMAHFNHTGTTVSTGEEALEFFRSAQQKGQPFDAVITDLGMPKMDGHQVARAIKAESPGTPVIMMTGWGTMMKEDGQTIPEIDALVGKPPEIQELNQLLLRLASAKTGKT